MSFDWASALLGSGATGGVLLAVGRFVRWRFERVDRERDLLVHTLVSQLAEVRKDLSDARRELAEMRGRIGILEQEKDEQRHGKHVALNDLQAARLVIKGLEQKNAELEGELRGLREQAAHVAKGNHHASEIH